MKFKVEDMTKNAINLSLIIVSFIMLSFAAAFPASAQQSGLPASMNSPQVQQAIRSGQVSQQSLQQATESMQRGDVSPEQLQRAREAADMGSLSPQEIQMGKQLMDQRDRSAGGASGPDADKKKTDEESDEDREEDKEQEEKEQDLVSELEIFGHNLFSDAPEAFAPIKSMPVSNDYIIGPGDEIRVYMWGRLDESHSLEVDTEGVINLPKIGPLTVAGLTFGELKELIRDRAEAITGVNVNVSMGKLKTLQVFILGEVKNPGIHTVSSLSTVTNALLAAGGPTKMGSLRRVQLKRREQIIAVMDLYDLLLKGDVSADTTLMSGDVIFVPQAGPLVAISGTVKRPGIYELKDIVSLENALDMAGGLAPSAYSQRIQIERSVDNKELIVLDISDDQLRRGRTVDLKDGDVVRIFSILPTAVNAVYLYGNVARPGRYAYHTGLRLGDVLMDVESVLPDTYFDYALIKRYRFAESQAELIPFDLGRLLFSGDNRQNIALMPGDEIYVFNQSQFQDKAYADVKGEVREPDRYAIDDMTLRDLILKAGGLTPNAYMPRAELIRYDKDRNQHTIYFDVAAVMAEDPAQNIKVRHQDEVIIHSVLEDQWEKIVSVMGEVNNPGEYTLTEGMRLRDLIFKSGSFTRDAYMEMGHLRRTAPMTKKITIHAFNVAKAMAGDPEHNPRLSDLDEIIIYSIWDYKEKYTVAINGLVRNPGDYPYAENMMIHDLILLAGNVRDAAYMEEAELIRFTIEDGRTVETNIITFNIRLAQQDHPQHNLKLKPMDVVTIKQIPDWWERTRLVAITGEVFFPGTYQIKKDELLSSVIERAGGFTEYAYLRGAQFTRESVQEIQQQRMNEMLQELELEIARLSSEEVKKSLSEEDLAAQSEFIDAQQMLIEKLQQSRATGRVIISLGSLSSFRGSSTDLTLEDGDALHIPKQMNTVNVMGSVYNPTALIFDEDNPELAYYLERTGGPTENADEDLIYVIRGDGTVVSKMRERSWWRRFENIELYPGDTVLVPEKLVRSNWMRDTKDITQILYQIATTAGVTAALF